MKAPTMMARTPHAAAVLAGSAIAMALVACNRKTAAVDETPTLPQKSVTTPPADPSTTDHGDPGAQAIVTVQRLGADGSVVSEWTRGPDDPPLVRAGRLDAAPFQHPSPDRWYYLVADHEQAFTVNLQGNGAERPRGETREVKSPDGVTTESKISITHGDKGSFMEVIATPLVGPSRPRDEGAIGLHAAMTMDERGFTVRGIRCNKLIADTTSCSIAAEREDGSKTIQATFWSIYLEQANLMVSVNAFDVASTEARILAVGLIFQTFNVGASRNKPPPTVRAALP